MLNNKRCTLVSFNSGEYSQRGWIFFFFFETGPDYVAQAALKLLDSSEPPTRWDYRHLPPCSVRDCIVNDRSATDTSVNLANTTPFSPWGLYVENTEILRTGFCDSSKP
jgi:hypothetical protein